VTSTTGTNLLLNGTLVTAFSGLTVGWLDNSRLLVNNYATNVKFGPYYSGCAIFGPNGALTGGACALPLELQTFQPVTSDGIYATQFNEIFSVSTGAVTWASGNPEVGNVGAVAGSNVIFVSGTDVLAQSY